MAWEKMVDLELDDESFMDTACPMPIDVSKRSHYPYGLRITLTDKELKKLGLDADCKIDETLEFEAVARVTCVSKDGESCRVELQIEQMMVESEEEERAETANKPRRRSPLYAGRKTKAVEEV